MFRFRPGAPESAVRSVAEVLAEMGPRTAVFSVLGHKADFLLMHFRDSFDALSAVETALHQAGLAQMAEPTTSYVSVVELGLYESTGKVYADLAARGIAPHSAEWAAGVAETMDRQRTAMASRLFPEIPNTPYLCFYPMDRRRGESANWYTQPMADRARMMHEHGLNGRRYAGKVRQIISGSIGFDDWEWAVDLFSEEPLDFKRLIYEMRFDEVSAVYAEFGPFYLGVRRQAADLPRLAGIAGNA
jgi:chlorite dismutase